MVKRFLVVLALATAGCAHLLPVSGNGRFLQYSLNGLLYAQLDTSTPEACKREGNTERGPGVEAICSMESLEAMLPTSFTITNPLTGEKTKARTRTLKACELMRKQFGENKSLANYEVSGCAQIERTTDNKRYFQVIDTSEQGKGKATFQIDFFSSGQCIDMANATVFPPGSVLVVTCSDSSQMANLPFSSIIRNVSNEEKVVVRAMNINNCEGKRKLVSDILRRAGSSIEATECK